jgi:hypothetical protein
MHWGHGDGAARCRRQAAAEPPADPSRRRLTRDRGPMVVGFPYVAHAATSGWLPLRVAIMHEQQLDPDGCRTASGPVVRETSSDAVGSSAAGTAQERNGWPGCSSIEAEAGPRCGRVLIPQTRTAPVRIGHSQVAAGSPRADRN